MIGVTEPPPLLDPESPWPVSTGTLGRTFGTTAVGPGETELGVAWTYKHDAELVGLPVVTRDGEVVLIDGRGRLSLVSIDGGSGWSTTLDVAPVETFNSPAVWRCDGRTLVSVSHEGGVLLIEPGSGVVGDVPIEPPARFLCLREDGLVTWSREAVSLIDGDGTVIDEHRFVWRSDDIALPTVGPNGAVYFLENREYSPSWDSEAQYIEVARVTFDGGAERESVFAAHAHTTDAVGSLCATEEQLFWILDGWRLGRSSLDGEAEEVDTDGFPAGAIPSRILGGYGTTVLIQREEAGRPIYALTGGDVTAWPVEDPVERTVIDAGGTAYLLTDGRLQAVEPDGTQGWTTPSDGRWLAAASGRLLLSDADGKVTGLGNPS